MSTQKSKKEKHLTIRLEENLLETLTKRAEEKGVNRSTYIRDILFVKMNEDVLVEIN